MIYRIDPLRIRKGHKNVVCPGQKCLVKCILRRVMGLPLGQQLFLSRSLMQLLADPPRRLDPPPQWLDWVVKTLCRRDCRKKWFVAHFRKINDAALSFGSKIERRTLLGARTMGEWGCNPRCLWTALKVKSANAFWQRELFSFSRKTPWNLKLWIKSFWFTGKNNRRVLKKISIVWSMAHSYILKSGPPIYKKSGYRTESLNIQKLSTFHILITN